MNILYLTNSVHLGGDTKCIIKLCKEFRSINNIFIASKGGVLQKEFEKMGIKHFKILDVENKNPINIIRNIILIKKIIENNDIDLIHSHHRMTTLIAKLVRVLQNVKIVHTQHLCIENKLKLTKVALSNVEIITVSNDAKKILVNKVGLKENNITTIYNTIEEECRDKQIDNRLIRLKEEGYFIVAQASRIIGYKGIYDFVDIAEKVSKINKSIKFIFLGDGPERNTLQKVIEQKKLENVVMLLGAKDNVIEHLKHIDLMILCSYIEGLPLTPLEAFSQYVPVIATNIDGTNEEIIDGYNGYLIEKKDINNFVKRILEIYEDEQLYTNLKNNAYKIYNEKFNNNIYKSSHNKIYNEIKLGE